MPGASFTTVNSFDLDHYRAQPGNWNVQAEQLSRGSFRSQIRSLQYEDLIVYDNRWGAASMIRGESPAGWVMFGGVIMPERASVNWCGQVTDDQLFACTPERHAIEFTLARGAHDVVFLIKPEVLVRVSGDASLEGIMRPGLLDFRHRGSQLIRFALVQLQRLEHAPDLLAREIIASDIKAELLALLELCFRPLQQLPEWTVPRNRRVEAVDAALSEAWRSRGLTSALEMARAAGVSQRTLELAFTSQVGMTPGKYLKLHRLNQSHNALARGDAETTSVTEVALSMGFSHPGRFSAEYRKLFGELPSETLAT